MRYSSRVPFLLLVLGLLACLWTAGRRVMGERAARTVELTVDLEQLRQLSDSTGVLLTEALDQLKQVGVASIAVGEQSLAELETDGLIHVRQAAPGLRRGVTMVRIADPALYQ